jgi:hypothetical protein
VICGRCGEFRTRFIEFLAPHLRVCRDPRWSRVTEAREEGNAALATRRAKTIMGIKGKEMPEERREYLRRHNAEHKEEIQFRAKMKRQERRALKSALKARGRQIRRKA